jgi:hypothetical protein
MAHPFNNLVHLEDPSPPQHHVHHGPHRATATLSPLFLVPTTAPLTCMSCSSLTCWPTMPILTSTNDHLHLALSHHDHSTLLSHSLILTSHLLEKLNVDQPPSLQPLWEHLLLLFSLHYLQPWVQPHHQVLPQHSHQTSVYPYHYDNHP